MSGPTIGPVTSLPGYGPTGEGQLAGYLPANDDESAWIYVWFVPSRRDPASDPIVIWLNGGPGSSSFIGFFRENGPYRIQPDGTLADNPFSWNNRASYLMIDQPPGTGLSTVTRPDGYARTEDEGTAQLYHGLQRFFDRYPALRERELYIFGESFAGTYLPMLATAILDGNTSGQPVIRLSGMGVGDGWVDPLIQQSTYGDYAYAHGLINLPQKAEVDRLYASCAAEINQSQPVTSREADKVCNCIEEYITRVSGGANVYDIREVGDYNFDDIGRYLDRVDVRQALHVASTVGPWAETASRVAFLLERGEQNSAALLYPRLFESLRVLIYNGVYDMDCNFMGTDAWLGRLRWPSSDAFLRAPRTPWTLGGQLAGHIRQVGKLTQLLVLGAGHMVPMDQPGAALAMLDAFLDGTLGPQRGDG